MSKEFKEYDSGTYVGDAITEVIKLFEPNG